MAFAGVSSHQRIVAGMVGKARRVVTDAAKDTDIQVDITSGFQAGLSRKLRVSELSFGADGANDVVLLDDAATPKNVKINFFRSAFGTLADVHAADGALTVADAKLAAGETLTDQTLPLTVNVGETRIVLRRADEKVAAKTSKVKAATYSSAGRFFRHDPVLVTSFAGFFVALFAAFVMSGPSNFSDNHYVTLNNPTAQPTAVIEKVETDWTVQVQERLVEFELADHIRIDELPSGLLRLTGRISDEDVTSVRAMQTWIDTQADMPTTLWKLKRSPKLDMVPTVSMVRLSEPAGVYLENGAEVRLGQNVIDGWTLTDVTQNEITLERDGESIRVDLVTGELS